MLVGVEVRHSVLVAALMSMPAALKAGASRSQRHPKNACAQLCGWAHPSGMCLG